MQEKTAFCRFVRLAFSFFLLFYSLRYVVTDESGPDHNKHFVVEVHLNSNCIGKGEGHSKKLAEQQAAKEALALMGY